jgi:hypothetical protein
MIIASADATPSNALSYAWDFGDSGVSTDVNPTHIYATAGTYTVSLIAYGPCESDTILFDVTPNVVGLDEIGFDGLAGVYPNPSTGVFNVEFSELNAKKIQLNVLDVLGKRVYSDVFYNSGSTMIHSIDLANVIDGMYFLTLVLDGIETTTIRILKK